MFISLVTSKGEKISLNIDKVLFLAETKKGCSIILEDGTILDLSEAYEEVFKLFEPFE